MGIKSGNGEKARKRQGKRVSNARGKAAGNLSTKGEEARVSESVALEGGRERLMRVLEPRILLDAAGAATFDIVTDDDPHVATYPGRGDLPSNLAAPTGAEKGASPTPSLGERGDV